MADPISVTCPYCWSRFDHWPDTVEGDQQYVEDCRICCNPIRLGITLDVDGNVRAVDARRENE